MKYILLLLLPLWSYGQQSADDAPAFSRTVTIQGVHGKHLFSTAIVYTKRFTNRFYAANKEAKEHAPLLTRKTLDEHNRKSLLGYENMDRDKQEVMANALMVYESAGDDKCMQLLAISGDVRIDCRQGTADIRLINLKYHHLRKNKPATLVPISYGDKSIAIAGSYNDLKGSNICPEELSALDAFVQTAANKILDNVAAGMGGNLKEVDW